MRKSFGISEKIDIVEMNKYFSNLNEENMRNYIVRTLNNIFSQPKKKIRNIIIDTSTIPMGINTKRKFYSDEEIEEKGVCKGFSSTIGFFLGYKLVLCLHYDTKQPLYISLENGLTHNVNFFTQTLEEMKNRRILGEKSIIITDKGFFKFDNYKTTLLDYKIVPLIYPKSNTKLETICTLFNHKI